MRLLFLSFAWFMLWFGQFYYERKHPILFDFSTVKDYVTVLMYNPLLYLGICLLVFGSLIIVKRIMFFSIKRMVYPYTISVNVIGLLEFIYSFYIGVQGVLLFPRLTKVIIPLILILDFILWLGKKQRYYLIQQKLRVQEREYI